MGHALLIAAAMGAPNSSCWEHWLPSSSLLLGFPFLALRPFPAPCCKVILKLFSGLNLVTALHPHWATVSLGKQCGSRGNGVNGKATWWGQWCQWGSKVVAGAVVSMGKQHGGQGNGVTGETVWWWGHSASPSAGLSLSPQSTTWCPCSPSAAGKQLLITAVDRAHRVVTNLAAALLFLKGAFLHIFNNKSDRCHIKNSA